jgi:tetratricopeptide (TPR) repeat protein
VTLGLLGYAQLQLGDVAEAILSLEQAVAQADRYRSRQVQSQFRSYLGEAYSQSRQFKQAYDIALRGLQLAEAISYPAGMGYARRSLGLIAYVSGNWREAETHFQSALEVYLEHFFSIY